MEGGEGVEIWLFFFFTCDVFVVKSSRRLLYCKASLRSENENKDDYESFFLFFFSNLSQFVDVSSGNIIGVSGRTRVEEPSRFCAIFVPACAWTVAVAKKTNLCTLYFQNKGLLQKNENGVHYELLPFVRTSWPDQLVHI